MNPDIQLIWLDLRNELEKFIFSKIKEPASTQDILQDVMVKIHLRIHQLKDPDKLTSWVYQITRNTITDYFKQPQFERATVELADDEQKEHVYQSLSNCINLKISKLSLQDRQAVLLTYFKDYSQKELADYLGISYSGAKNRVQRAREKLRLSILDCENVETDQKGNITDYNK